MCWVKGKRWLVSAIIAIATMCVVTLTVGTLPAKAAENRDSEYFLYTLITNEAGESSYQVALRPAARPLVEYLIIPETYEGLPVTEVANNGFVSCAKLQKVILPQSVEKLGNNAFMNCAKLQYVGMPGVKSIGNTAFAMCPALDRLYIPQSVETVGTYILRNNPNTVYIQQSESEIGAGWSANWNTYFTGQTVYSADPEDTLSYREILDSAGEVIGYEIEEGQMATLDDVVIYNCMNTESNPEYLPVLNICAEAFLYTQANSITIKDRHSDDPSVPSFNHKINIRSNAFLMSFVQTIDFEVGVTFEHPENLVTERVESQYDFMPIVGDANGKSIRIFEESTVESITLPADLEIIPAKMFYNCAYLREIQIAGKQYNGINMLPEINGIGERAFAACTSLSNVTVPDSVIDMGESVFFDWGFGEKQKININIYEDEIPASWNSGWADHLAENAEICYKEQVKITLDWQIAEAEPQKFGIKPETDMPEMDLPQRKGYTFLGVFTQPDGTGIQYYSNTMQNLRTWQHGDPTVWYGVWNINVYTITYNVDWKGQNNPNPVTYTVEDEFTLTNLVKKGYQFNWGVVSVVKGTTGNLTIDGTWKIEHYAIIYMVDLKGNDNPEASEYTVEDEIVFTKLEKAGYTFEWQPARIPKGSTGEQVITGVWTPIRYNIYYSVTSDTTHSNPATYTVEEAVVFSEAKRGGYFVTWSIPRIPLNSTGDVTVHAEYVEKTLDQCLHNGVYEIYTRNQFWQLPGQPNGGQGRVYSLQNDIYTGGSGMPGKWTPIDEFKGILEGNGYYVGSFSIIGLDADNSNIGFCRVNSGTIRRLRLEAAITNRTYANVNMGIFAGVNNGTIENCSAYPGGTISLYSSIGSGCMGGIAGVNKDTIRNCTASFYMEGSCDMGGIAGINENLIDDCTSHVEIQINYSDYNASVGGIVGKQIAGRTINCFFDTKIYLMNYRSSKYSIGEDREMQLCVGIIIGYLQGGTSSNNTSKAPYNKNENVYTSIELHVVTWKTGVWPFQKTHTNDQGLYFRNELIGRSDV